MKDTPRDVMEKWYRCQDKYVIMYDYGMMDGSFIVSDLHNDILCLETFDSRWDAIEWCYELHHDLLDAPEKQWDTTAKVIEYLEQQEVELLLNLGLEFINKRQQDVLGLMLTIVRDAMEMERKVQRDKQDS